MATIKFLLRTTGNPSSIFIRLVDGRKVDIRTTTKYSINPADWSESKQRPKNLKNPDYKKLDEDLHDLRTNLLHYYNNTTEPVNLMWLKDFLNPSESSEIPTDLIHYIDYYKKAKENDLSEAARKKYNLIQAKMKRFQASRKKTILIKDINESFKEEFVKYYKKENYSKNTMQRELVFIKTFCKHAKSKGVPVSLELDGLRLDREPSDFIHLSFDELELIDKIDPLELGKTLNNAKDWLIISCYTGQRVSDFMRFSAEMIRTQGGKQLIEFKQVKTGKIMTLPLHPKVIEVLNRRNGSFPASTSDQRYNDHIKLVCEKAGLIQEIEGSKSITRETGKIVKGKDGKNRKETETRKIAGTYRKCDLVSSHIGRRSFATNFYGKIPTSLLIAATGHSTEEMFLVYIGKSNADKALQLSEWF